MSISSGQPVPAAWRGFFLVAAIYDLGLGLAFMVAGEQVLTAIGMELPPHIAFIQLAAVFVFVQGLSYLFPWRDAWSNTSIVWVGVAYKAGYAGLAAWYLALGMLPSTFFVPWAIVDLLFLVGFVWFIRVAAAQKRA